MKSGWVGVVGVGLTLLVGAVLSLVSSQQAWAFPASEQERDRLPEARLHDQLRDRGPELPDAYVAAAGQKKVALYVDNGVWSAGKSHFKRLLRHYGRSYRVVTAKDVRAGILDPAVYGVLIVPGGKSWKYLASLGEEGAEKIRLFVAAGGGYMGICAGAYYATSHRFGPDPVEPYGIGLLEGVAFDGTSLNVKPFHDGMNSYDVDVPGFKSSYQILLLGGSSFRYTAEEEAAKRIRVLGRVRKIHEPTMITFNYGTGRVFLSGPHGEIEERQYLLGLIFRDQDSEWPLLDAALTFLSGGPAPGGFY